MVGFVAAVFAEVFSGTPVAEQLGIAPVSIGLVFALFTVASLVPILRVRGTICSSVSKADACRPVLLLPWLVCGSESARGAESVHVMSICVIDLRG